MDDGDNNGDKVTTGQTESMYRGTIQVRTVSGLSYMQCNMQYAIISSSQYPQELKYMKKCVSVKPVHPARIERIVSPPHEKKSPYIRNGRGMQICTARSTTSFSHEGKNRTPYIPALVSEGSVELAEIRQLVSSLWQEASLCAIEGNIPIARDQVVVFQPRNDSGQELDLPFSITIRSKVVNPDWLALGLGCYVIDGVLEVLLTIRTGSPEPMHTQETDSAAGRLALFEEICGPFHIAWVLEIAWSAK